MMESTVGRLLGGSFGKAYEEALKLWEKENPASEEDVNFE